VYGGKLTGTADIEQIEQRRVNNREMEALYILTPESHIVDCVLADLERKKYKQASLLWTGCEIFDEFVAVWFAKTCTSVTTTSKKTYR